MNMSTPWFSETKTKIEYSDIIVKFKRLHDRAVLPAVKTEGASGADLHAIEESKIQVGQIGLVPLGFAVEFPRGLEMQIRPRSGLASKNGVTVLNTPGTVDSDYRGEIKVILINLGKEIFTISPGDRIAQAVFSYVAPVTYVEMEDLSKTSRDTGGFGSTGRA